jgi:beta-lactamase regulating signal transducer with metallopeptidase domain
MADLVQHPVIQALAWALVHFVWQGAAIGLAAFVAFRVVRASASWRYAIGVGALVAALAAPVATFIALIDNPAQPASAGATLTPDVNQASTVARQTLSAAEPAAAGTAPALGIGPEALGLAVVGWMFGVAFFTIRLLGGWVVARRMARQAVRPAAAHIQALAARVAERLALKRAVAVLESSAVVVPVMVGWLKPTIVLPVAALAGLTPTQVEALLAHELAHVRRHDYLVNLLQSAAEALLFYHPVVWWLSRRIRIERELCCDDLAVGVCDRLVYATALTDLAAMTSPRVALAATDGDLLGRVRRILGHDDVRSTGRAGWMSALALALVAGVGVPVVMASATQAPPSSAREVVALPSLPEPAVESSAAEFAVGVAEQSSAAQQTEQRRREELRRQIEALLRELAKTEIAQAAEVKARAADEQKKAVEQAMRAHEAQADVARQRIEEIRKLHEKGLVSHLRLQEMEAALATAQAHGNVEAMAAARLKEAQIKLARSKELVEKGLMSTGQFAEIEAVVKSLEQRVRDSRLPHEALANAARDAQTQAADTARLLSQVQAAQRASREAAAEAAAAAQQDQAKLRAELAQRLDRVAREVEAQHRAVVSTVIGATEPVKVGDIVRVAIDGEPDLPPNYTVRADGTIRLLFVGSIKVVGLTTVQVRDAIGRQLADRKLGSASQVKVSVSRPAHGATESHDLVIHVPVKKDLPIVTIKKVETVKEPVKKVNVVVKKGGK